MNWSYFSTLKGWHWLLIIYIIALPVFFKPGLHGADPLGYYAWLRSFVIDGDFNVDNEFADLKFDNYYRIYTSTGYRFNQWSVGPALFWAPFYGTAHLLTIILARLGCPWPADGYSLPYVTAASLATTVYTLLGLLLLYDVLKNYVSDLTAVLAVVGVWFASPVVFYMYSHPLMSHGVDVFVNAFFVWVWQRTRPRPTWQGWLARGACIGLAIVIRPQNALLAAAPGIELLIQFIRSKERLSARVLRLCQQGTFFSVGILLLYGMQVLAWRMIYGLWMMNGYSLLPATKEGIFNFSAPRLLQLLFSNNHGLFIWSPLLLPAVVGLGMLVKRDKFLALLLGLHFILQVYFISANVWWDGGGPSFGARYLLGSTPAFIIGLAILFDFLLKKRIRFRTLVIITGVFIIWNTLLVVQYALETIPRSGPMDIVQMVRNQFLVIPQNLPRLIQALVARRPE